MTPTIAPVGSRFGVIQDGCVLRTLDTIEQAKAYVMKLVQ